MQTDGTTDDLRAAPDSPDVRWSIVVPTYNRPSAIAQTAASLAHLTPTPGGFEVIVVDDGSPEPLVLPEIEGHIQVHLHRQPNAGPAAARNTGARLARGRRLAFTDDDCCPRPDWLLQLDAALDRAPDALVGGATINALRRNACSAASQDVVRFLYRVENADPTDAGFFASNNIAVPRQTFLDAGGFDASFPIAAGEDRAFCEQWRADGRRLVYAPQAVVDHHHRLTLATYWRQHRNYGRGARRLRRHRAQQSTRPAGLEGWRFYSSLVAEPFRKPAEPMPIRRTALLVLAQVATAYGYAAQRLAAPDPADPSTNPSTSGAVGS